MATLKNTVIHVGYIGKQHRLHIVDVKKLKKWAKNRFWGTQEATFSVKNIRNHRREEYRVTNSKEFLERIKHCQRSWEREGNYRKVPGGNRLDWTQRVHWTALGYKASLGKMLVGYYEEQHGPNSANEALDNYIKTEHQKEYQKFLNSFELEG